MDEVERFKEGLRLNKIKGQLLKKAFITAVIAGASLGLYYALGEPGTEFLEPIVMFLTYDYILFLFFLLITSPIIFPVLLFVSSIVIGGPLEIIRHIKRKRRQETIRESKRNTNND